MKNLDIHSLAVPLEKFGVGLKRYGGVLFFLLIATVYAFMILRINTLSNVQVDQSEVSSRVKATGVPRVHAADAERLEGLKDNSVNVQTLFEQNRTNPFQE